MVQEQVQKVEMHVEPECEPCAGKELCNPCRKLPAKHFVFLEQLRHIKVPNGKTKLSKILVVQ